jgi:hypothetical protein
MAVLRGARKTGPPAVARRAGGPALAAWVRAARRRYGYVLFILALLAPLPTPAATSREYQIKAAFLFNFAQFTEWPPEALADPQAPLVIGILGSNPFGDFVEQTVRNELVHGRRIAVEYYTKVTEIKTCHILYVGQSEADRLERVREAVKGKPVLTVSDIENAGTHGIMIEFLTAQNRIRFRIDAETAKAARLVLSAKLLRVANPSPR